MFASSETVGLAKWIIDDTCLVSSCDCTLQILTPFLLRRVKADVDLEIPPKKEILVYCPMTSRQNEFYKATVDKTMQDLLGNGVKEEVLNVVEKGGRGMRKKESIDYSVHSKHSMIQICAFLMTPVLSYN